ncbi:hypothetical protein HYC85_005006 [Camellia sinensis]|uniref:Uncharacterized protein n=1 Tax=Camellia sinensis TaxID=4442 RepID=A0A7J7HZT7_CAMSI|nr:hypothetical protein HYC85_005006 [Camellia sinensis]
MCIVDVIMCIVDICIVFTDIDEPHFRGAVSSVHGNSFGGPIPTTFSNLTLMEDLAYDRVAIKFRGTDADLQQVVGVGKCLVDTKMKNLTKEEFVHVLRRQSAGFSRGTSKYRGVTLHKCGRWEARMGQFLGKNIVMVLKTVNLLKNEIPFEEESVVLFEDVKTGLVLVNIINGFCTIGAGNLAPTEPNSQINETIDESTRQAKFLHFLIPTILENSNIPILIASLALMNLIWFLALFLSLMCSSEMVGEGTKCNDKVKRLLRSMEEDGSNMFVDWVKNNQIKAVSIYLLLVDGYRYSHQSSITFTSHYIQTTCSILIDVLFCFKCRHLEYHLSSHGRVNLMS